MDLEPLMYGLFAEVPRKVDSGKTLLKYIIIITT